MPHVFSTLANDQTYANYAMGPNGVNEITESVFIAGGAGVANKRLITPLGIATEVDDDQLKILHRNPAFLAHLKANHLLVRDKKADPDKVATDMNRQDKSAPLTEADYLDADGVTVKTGSMR